MIERLEPTALFVEGLAITVSCIGLTISLASIVLLLRQYRQDKRDLVGYLMEADDE